MLGIRKKKAQRFSFCWRIAQPNRANIEAVIKWRGVEKQAFNI